MFRGSFTVGGAQELSCHTALLRLGLSAVIMSVSVRGQAFGYCGVSQCFEQVGRTGNRSANVCVLAAYVPCRVGVCGQGNITLNKLSEATFLGGGCVIHSRFGIELQHMKKRTLVGEFSFVVC